MRRALPLVLALALVALPARAEDPPATDPLDRLLGELGVALEHRTPAALRSARVRLRSAGEPAVRRLLERLAERGPADPLAAEWVRLLGESEAPSVEPALARAATAHDPSVRAAAAHGLARERAGADGAGLAALIALASDPLPGVRAAALRALFARERDDAVAARAALPRDPLPELAARRLALHRLRDDRGAALVALAEGTWRSAAAPVERLAAARLLASQHAGAPTAALREIVAECGHGAAAATLVRWARARGTAGYDAAEERRAAVEALLALLLRVELAPEERAALVERAVEWIAHPVPLDPRRPDQIPELGLRRRVVAQGALALAALERRLLAGGFDSPRDATTLVAEFDEQEALPVLVRLLDRERPQGVRVAASSALRVLGTLGDEALARRLVAVEEEAAVRRDAIAALAHEPAAWAVPVLTGLLARTDAETVEAAADALELRAEPEARAALEEFALGPACPEHRTSARLTHLLRPWDARARALWERALAHGRAHLRGTALSLAARLPAARLGDVLDALRAHTPRLSGAREVEAWIGAMGRGSPREMLAYVRERWDDFPVGESLASTRCRALAALDLVREPALEPEAVGLLLERVGAASDPAQLSHALDALAGRRGVRDDELDALFRRLLEGRGVEGSEEQRAELEAAAVAALASPGRGDLVEPLLSILARQVEDPDSAHRAVAVLAALRHQPWARVEPAVLALALDPTRATAARAAAGRLLAGRASAHARERLADWLVTTRQGEPEPAVLLALAAAAGTGADARTAERMADALRDEVLAFHSLEAPPDPFEPRIDALPARVQALAAGAAHARAPAALLGLVDLLLEPRFVRWADEVLVSESLNAARGDALDALAPPSDGRAQRLETGTERASLLATEVVQTTLGLKALGDAPLAEALEAAVGAALADPARCAFPDAWPAKLAALLHDPRSGGLPAAAARVERLVEALEPVDGPFDLALALSRSEAAAEAGRFDEAAREARRARGMLVRRGDDLHPAAGGAYRRLVALESAWRAAELGARGDAAGARAALAALDAGALADDPALLAQLARAAAQPGVAPEAAEGLARLALALERRADAEETLETVAALAEVLLRVGRARDAADRLDEALGTSHRPEHARHHLLLARCLSAAGDREGALRALKPALRAEPALASRLADDPWLAPLREDGALDRVVREAAEARAASSDD
jgi:hypothetical protein